MVTKKTALKKTKRTQTKAKRARSRHISKTDTHFLIKRSLLSYAVLVFLFFALLSMSVYLVDRMIVENSHHRRRAQIVSIYRDLNLGENYRPISSNIFGDKRVYSWDKHRSYASAVTYGHNATVGDTVKELSEKVKKAGFTQQKIEYEGSSSPVYEFKNDKGNWLRIRAIPKADRDDAVYGTKNYQFINTETTNAMAPTHVEIKVNLDDNNE